jgi:hypothetical protein
VRNASTGTPFYALDEPFYAALRSDTAVSSFLGRSQSSAVSASIAGERETRADGVYAVACPPDGAIGKSDATCASTATAKSPTRESSHRAASGPSLSRAMS